MSAGALYQRIGSCKLPHGYIISLGATPTEYGTVITATKLEGGSYRYLIRSTGQYPAPMEDV